MSEDRCKLCEEKLPQLALHFSNKIAIKYGWCSFLCMNSDLGEEKAHTLLKENQEENQSQ